MHRQKEKDRRKERKKRWSSPEIAKFTAICNCRMPSPLLGPRKQKGDGLIPCPHGFAAVDARVPSEPLLMEARSPHSLWHGRSQSPGVLGWQSCWSLHCWWGMQAGTHLSCARCTARSKTLAKNKDLPFLPSTNLLPMPPVTSNLLEIYPKGVWKI